MSTIEYKKKVEWGWDGMRMGGGDAHSRKGDITTIR